MKLKNTLYKIITGNTKTPLVSGVAWSIVFDKDLSSQIYSKIGIEKQFIISKNNKKYLVTHLQNT